MRIRPYLPGFVVGCARLLTGLPVVLLLGGCGLTGAPSFSLFGAFFPAWLLCSVLGIFCAILTRILFVATGLADVLPLQLFLCTAVGLLFGALTWLLFFG